MGYIIRADYHTGDSEGSEDTYIEFPPVWEDIGLAKKAMRWLADHYDHYRAQDDRWYEGKANPKEAPHKPWYVDERCGMWYLSIKVELDNGELFQMHVPYCGWAEGLHKLTILVKEPDIDEMSITFRGY